MQFNLVLGFIGLTLFFFSCKEVKTPEAKEAVYILAREQAGPNQPMMGVVYKDGVPNIINANNNSLWVIDFTVHNSDVYVLAQQTTSNGTDDFQIFKNGVSIQSLGNGLTFYPNGIAMINQDIKVVGVRIVSNKRRLSLWANGVISDITTNNLEVQSPSITAIGSDTYITAQQETFPNNTGWSIAKYWKNGSEVVLGDSVSQSLATGIAVSGSDVLVSGYRFSKPCYWKNKSITYLANPNGNINGFTNTAVINGSDFYIGGMLMSSPGKEQAVYWKNGNLVELTTDQFKASANDMKIKDNNLYFVGYSQQTSSSNKTAMFWKNNTPTVLNNSSTVNSEAIKIIVQ
jgi:hypothetical protein